MQKQQNVGCRKTLPNAIKCFAISEFDDFLGILIYKNKTHQIIFFPTHLRNISNLLKIKKLCLNTLR
jgi:hypothetical protein